MAVKGKQDIAAAVLKQHYPPKSVDELIMHAEAIGYSRTDEVGPWQLYRQGQRFFAVGRREGKKEEYAIIQGEAPAEAVQSDLEQMASGMLKGNWFYNTFLRLPNDSRAYSRISAFALAMIPFSVLGAAVITSTEYNPVVPKILGGVALSCVAGYVGGKMACDAHDRRITRGLSEHALHYKYGGTVEWAINDKYEEFLQRQRRGQLHDAIMEGLLPREALVGDHNIVVRS